MEYVVQPYANFTVNIPRDEFENQAKERLNQCKRRRGDTNPGDICKSFKAIDLVPSMVISEEDRNTITDFHNNKNRYRANEALLDLCDRTGKYADLVAALRVNDYKELADLLDPYRNVVLLEAVGAVGNE